MSHTPFPWHIMPGDVVPGVRGLGIFGADGTPVATVYHTFKDRERDNARLFAAAPEMHDACEADAVFWRHYIRCPKCAGTTFCPDAMMMAATASSLRAIALAKAKGEVRE